MRGTKTQKARRTTVLLDDEDDAAIKWLLEKKLAFSTNGALRLALHGYVETKRVA